MMIYQLAAVSGWRLWYNGKVIGKTASVQKDKEMPIEDVVIEKVRRLPPDQQEEVLRFVEYLEFRQHPALERVIAEIRERADSLESGEMQSLIEEAREEYYYSSHAA